MSDSILSNRLYDQLKYVALVVLPAFSALYFGLGEIWDLPKVTEVIGTVAVLDTVLGIILRSSNIHYRNSDSRFDGQIEVVMEGDDEPSSLNVDDDTAEAIEVKDEVLLKVNKDEPLNEEVVVVAKKAPRKRAPRKKT